MQAEIIDSIRFTAISPEMIRKMSVAKIVVPDTCNDEGYPIEGGLLDQRLGVVDPGLRCKTCHGSIKTCFGHFGHIELVRPVIHPEFAKYIYLLLNATCEHCGRVLLSDKEIESLNSSSKEQGQKLLRKLKSVSKCPHCNAELHKVKFERPTTFYTSDNNRLRPDEIRDRLAKITTSDLALFGIDGNVARPEWFVISNLLVPPVNIRPSITLESGERSEDDLTHKLLDILRANQKLEQDIDSGAPQVMIDDLWELLQYNVTTYFNNETPGVPVARHRSTKPLKTLAQRLKGKEGILRYNLNGKRVNFSARTVVSPDNNIHLNEIGMPQKIAENLTIPLYVTKWNIEHIRDYVKSESYPMAVDIILKDGIRRRITAANRKELIEGLEPGIIVERQLVDGDVVLFNRQPTLHRISIMAHFVKVLPGKTFRICQPATRPYNADFDGDEMNIHVPQSLEAQAEARYLMDAKDCILSARDGMPVIHLEEDVITGLYMLTNDDAYFTKDETARMLWSVGINELPKPASNGYYKGKDIFSMILPKDINLNYKDKTEIKDSKLVKGYISSSLVDEKGELILEVFAKYGSQATMMFIENSMRLALRAAYISGVTISIKDYYMDSKVLEEKKVAINELISKADELLKEYRENKLEAFPGYTKKQTYEMEVFATLDSAREKAKDILNKNIGISNNAMMMSVIKARGSIVSFVQTSMLLGQQAVSGGRPARGYDGRILPYFEKNDMSPKSRGFVTSNLLEGLDFIDYYMHAMGSRSSSLGKPLVTAISGYLQRRLIHAMQDFYVDENAAVKDADGTLLQPVYGGDAIDPAKEALANLERG